MRSNMETTARRSDWRETWGFQTKAVIKNVTENIPETITIPITARKSLFEFGSSKRNYGFAMVVSDARGYPSQGRTTSKVATREFNIQAEITVWNGCLIGIASHNLGKEVMAIYGVTELNEAESPTSFGSVKCKRLAYVKGGNYSGSSKYAWYDNISKSFYCISELVSALKSKLYSNHPSVPYYVEMFVSLKNQIHLRNQFFNSLTPGNEWMVSGVLDTVADVSDVSTTFDSFYKSVVSRAIELRRTGHRIVFAVIAHYFAKFDPESNQITYMDNNTISSEVIPSCRLITEARLATTNKYQYNEPLDLDSTVFTYIHKFDEELPFYHDEETKTLNVFKFISDESFREFAKKHQYDYVNSILDRHFYNFILNNSRPLISIKQDLTMDEEDRKNIIMDPKNRINSDTQTNVLLFIGSCFQYFLDKKENYEASKNKSEEQEVSEETDTLKCIGVAEPFVEEPQNTTEVPETPVDCSVRVAQVPDDTLDMSGLDSLVANHHN